MTTIALFRPVHYSGLFLSSLIDTFAKLATGAREGREIRSRYDGSAEPGQFWRSVAVTGWSD